MGLSFESAKSVRVRKELSNLDRKVISNLLVYFCCAVDKTRLATTKRLRAEDPMVRELRLMESWGYKCELEAVDSDELTRLIFS